MENDELILCKCDGCGRAYPLDNLYLEGVPPMRLCDECLKNDADAELQ